MIAELRGVTKKYGAVTALRDVTLELEAGRVTAVLGPNGAGKTSAVKLLLGLTRPSGGQVALFGRDPRSPEARRRTGVMLQNSKVPETLTVREHVHLFCSYYPAPMSVQAALAAADLTGVADRRYGSLSGGQRQRAIQRAAGRSRTMPYRWRAISRCRSHRASEGCATLSAGSPSSSDAKRS